VPSAARFQQADVAEVQRQGVAAAHAVLEEPTSKAHAAATAAAVVGVGGRGVYAQDAPPKHQGAIIGLLLLLLLLLLRGKHSAVAGSATSSSSSSGVVTITNTTTVASLLLLQVQLQPSGVAQCGVQGLLPPRGLLRGLQQLQEGLLLLYLLHQGLGRASR
jgi:hypothetical protein